MNKKDHKSTSANNDRRKPVEERFALFVTSATEPWGAEHSMATIITGLSELGADARVICSAQSVAAFLRDRTTAEVVLLETPSNKFLRYFSFARHLLKYRRASVSVVVFSVNLYFLSWILRLVPGWRPRLIADVHDTFIGERTLRRIGLALSQFHRVIYISEYVGTMVPATCDRRLVVRPISMPLTPAGKRDPARIIVGIAGRLDAEKRIELAIHAVALCGPEVVLNIYGDSFSSQSEYKASLEKLASKLPGNRVRFLGRVPSSEIYASIDILFVANSQEASGRTVGEAMAAGVPVIVPSRGGAQEFVQHNSSGLIYQSDSVSSAADAIKMLAASRDLRLKLSGRALTKIQSERSSSRVAQLYLDALVNQK